MVKVTIKEHLVGHKNHYYVLTAYRNDIKIAVHTSKSLNYINKLNKEYRNG